MGDIASLKIFDSLRTILRYIMTGVVFVLISYFLMKEDIEPHVPVFFKNNPWFFVVVASIVGFYTYAIHVTLLDNLWLLGAIKWLYGQHKTSRNCIDGILAKHNAANEPCYPEIQKVNREFVFRLLTYEYERGGTREPRFLTINRKLRESYNIMVFLYCCGYLLTTIFFIYVLHHEDIEFFSFNPNKDLDHKSAFILSMGIVSILVGFILDCQTTRREIWFISKYQLDGSHNLYPEPKGKDDAYQRIIGSKG